MAGLSLRHSAQCSPGPSLALAKAAPCLPATKITSKGTSFRHSSTAPGASAPYQAVVVGAGPAGVTVVGNLLERKVEPILWVDDAFKAGRINARYREVPSNTKVKLFADFATATAPFRELVSIDRSKSRALDALGKLDPERGCQLSYAADVLLMLTDGLRRTAGVVAQQGRVAGAALDERSKLWKVQVDSHVDGQVESAEAFAQRLVLCTGSSPNNSPLPIHIPTIQCLDLDLALSPTSLTSKLTPLGPVEVAVVGASHSAILVLRNLYNLACSGKPDLRIKWFTRHGLRYAEYMDGWILRDNTGLKGDAAEWAKANLEPETMAGSDVSRYITKIAYQAGDEKQVFARHMQHADYYVQAIGYSRDPIPTLTTSSGRAVTPHYNHETGSFSEGADGDAPRLPGLYGAGIAWPERVRDPHGNTEYAVGFAKFMKFAKRVSPTWN